MADALISEMAKTSIVTRARIVSRVVTGIHDDAFREFGINSPQFILLVIIASVGPVSRTAIARLHRQDRSTLSRNLQIMLTNGWIEERHDGAGRSRPLAVIPAGVALLRQIEPAWRASQSEVVRLLGRTGTEAICQVGNGLLADTMRS